MRKSPKIYVLVEVSKQLDGVIDKYKLNHNTNPCQWEFDKSLTLEEYRQLLRSPKYFVTVLGGANVCT